MELSNMGKRVREARRNAGLGQGQLGQMLNTSQSAISLYESGQRGMGFAMVDALCRATGHPLEYFLGTKETYHTVARQSPAGRLVTLVETDPEVVAELWDYAQFLRWRRDRQALGATG